MKGVACGYANTYFLAQDGSLLSCGLNSDGQAGFGSLVPSKPVPTKLHITIDESLIYVSCGGIHTIFISESGRVWGCGRNASGQLGLGHNDEAVFGLKEITYFSENNIEINLAVAGEEFTIFVTKTGEVYASGFNYAG